MVKKIGFIHTLKHRIIYRIEKLVSDLLLISNKNCMGNFRKYKISSIFDYSKTDFIYKESNKKCKYKIITEPRTCPGFEEKKNDIECYPDYISVFSGAKVLPGSDAIIKNDTILSDRFSYDRDASVVLGPRMVKAFNRQHVILEVKKTQHLKGEYIDLCYTGGQNIWHMTFDMLSKFRLINSIDAVKDVPILVDERMKTSQFARNYINYFNQHKHRMVYLKSDRLYDVDKIYTVSLSYLFMRAEKQSEDIFFVSNKAAIYARNVMLNKLHTSKTRKFFIQRGDGRLVNEQEVASFLRNRGFEVIQPESFALIDELSLFYNAACVVGAIGAAFTNSLYVKNMCNLICIAPEERIGLVNSYATITQDVGARVYYCRAETVSNDRTGTSGVKFSADMADMEKIYDYLFPRYVQ